MAFLRGKVVGLPRTPDEGLSHCLLPPIHRGKAPSDLIYLPLAARQDVLAIVARAAAG